jgi:pyruvate,water dikinase
LHSPSHANQGVTMPSIIKSKKSCRLLADDQQRVSKKYKHFKSLLAHNGESLQLISTIESLYYRGEGFGRAEINGLLDRLKAESAALIKALDQLSDGAYPELASLPESIFSEIAKGIEPKSEAQQVPFILPLDGEATQSTAAVGSKAANLSIIKNSIGLPVPDGFAVTTAAEAAFFDDAGLRSDIRDVLNRVHGSGDDVAEKLTSELRGRITAAVLPKAVEAEILAAYEVLEKEAGKDVLVAVRSSAVGEDTASSFAGQYHTELNVSRANLVGAYKKVIASRFTPRAIQYRRRYGFEEEDTPMGVVCLRMIDAAASGVIYTSDPVQPDSGIMRVAVVAGMGERLVSGEASPATFFIEKSSGRVVKREGSQSSNEDGKIAKVVDDGSLNQLYRMAEKLEASFNGPQDIEWAIDNKGKAFVLQSRPLGLHKSHVLASIEQTHLKDKPVLLSGGLTASPGIASGTVFQMQAGASSLPDGAILVARSASVDLTKLLKSIKGLITDIGSPASHLATVAREFGIPAIVDTRDATQILPEGETVTMVADSCKVYQGKLEETDLIPARSQSPIFESPMFLRLREALDLITPLNLQDPKDSSFSPAGCRTVHDIVRFCHEISLKAMFGLIGEAAETAVSEKLSFNIPISLHFIDLGGGLQEGLSSCDRIAPDSIRSVPMNALWKGLSHPGINWSSAVPVDMRNLATLMSATAGGEGLPGGDSYALVSQDYANVSIKFGYHYCNVDSLCGGNPGQNHVTMQFSGGVGSYYGKLLRIEFLSRVLTRLGFSVTANGDTISATLKGLDRVAQEDALDQLGRLLASSRLLDVGIRSQDDIYRMTEAFFRSEYDFMNLERAYALPGFYVPEGDWECRADSDGAWLVQDGSKWAGRFSLALAKRLNRMMGAKYQQFLDNIQAYFYFPLAIAKGGHLAAGSVRASVMPLDGLIDQAGGIAFGIQNIGNYFVFRLNSLEDNLVLFEYVNSRRMERQSVSRPLADRRWYHLRVQFEGRQLTAFVDDEPVMTYEADRNLEGYVGLWTKADSVIAFDNFHLSTDRNFTDLFGNLRKADYLRRIG